MLFQLGSRELVVVYLGHGLLGAQACGQNTTGHVLILIGSDGNEEVGMAGTHFLEGLDAGG